MVLEDRRAANKGDDDPDVVGHFRNAFVMPLALQGGANATPVWSQQLRINEG